MYEYAARKKTALPTVKSGKNIIDRNDNFGFYLIISVAKFSIDI